VHFPLLPGFFWFFRPSYDNIVLTWCFVGFSTFLLIIGPVCFPGPLFFRRAPTFFFTVWSRILRSCGCVCSPSLLYPPRVLLPPITKRGLFYCSLAEPAEAFGPPSHAPLTLPFGASFSCCVCFPPPPEILCSAEQFSSPLSFPPSAFTGAPSCAKYDFTFHFFVGSRVFCPVLFSASLPSSLFAVLFFFSLRSNSVESGPSSFFSGAFARDVLFFCAQAAFVALSETSFFVSSLFLSLRSQRCPRYFATLFLC